MEVQKSTLYRKSYVTEVINFIKHLNFVFSLSRNLVKVWLLSASTSFQSPKSKANASATKRHPSRLKKNLGM